MMRRRGTLAAAVLVAAGVLGLSGPRGAIATQEPAPPQAAYDLVIRDGRMLDGTGNPWRRADVAIRDGRIAAVGRLGDVQARRVIDAHDRYVAPGFIDVHSHAATGLARKGLEQGQPLLAQGITTIVANPDGGGPVDLAAQRATFERQGIGVNVALAIGHGSVREAVLGMSDRAPTPDELERMRELVRRGMQAGAFGLSSGLFYAPGSYAATDEVIALARVAAESGGVYTSHIRDESDYTIGLVGAVAEVIRIAEEAKLPGIVSHMKALGPDNWGLAVAATVRMEAARDRGVEIYADQYPYTASSTGVTGALIPRWAQVGGTEAMVERIGDPETRPRLLVEVRENIRRRGGPESLVVARYEPDRTLEGQHLRAIADTRGVPPEEAALDLVAAGSVSLVSFNMSEDDVEHIMAKTYTMTSSDGGLVPPTEGRPHPRNYGAFTRKLSRYVRERRTVDLPHAIRSMTGMPAAVFGMADRGAIREGAAADLVVFALEAIEERATYAEPHQLSKGMSFVLVNGVVVIDDERFTAELPGRVLSRAGR